MQGSNLSYDLPGGYDSPSPRAHLDAEIICDFEEFRTLHRATLLAQQAEEAFLSKRTRFANFIQSIVDRKLDGPDFEDAFLET